jgi:hypothetical protein
MVRADKRRRRSRNSRTRRRRSDELWRLGEAQSWRQGINNWNSGLIQRRTRRRLEKIPELINASREKFFKSLHLCLSYLYSASILHLEVQRSEIASLSSFMSVELGLSGKLMMSENKRMNIIFESKVEATTGERRKINIELRKLYSRQ